MDALLIFCVRFVGGQAMFAPTFSGTTASFSLFQPAHGFLGVFDEVEQAGGVARVVPGQLVGAQGQGGRFQAVLRAVLAGQGGGQVASAMCMAASVLLFQRAEPTRNIPLIFFGDASYIWRNIL